MAKKSTAQTKAIKAKAATAMFGGLAAKKPKPPSKAEKMSKMNRSVGIGRGLLARM